MIIAIFAPAAAAFIAFVTKLQFGLLFISTNGS